MQKFVSWNLGCAKENNIIQLCLVAHIEPPLAICFLFVIALLFNLILLTHHGPHLPLEYINFLQVSIIPLFGQFSDYGHVIPAPSSSFPLSFCWCLCQKSPSLAPPSGELVFFFLKGLLDLYGSTESPPSLIFTWWVMPLITAPLRT